MWQEKMSEKYQCPVCSNYVLEDNYDWIRGICENCQKKRHKQAMENIITLKEKAKKFDEIQKHWWWLQRRTHEGKTANVNIKTFLNGIKEYFEPYKED